MPKSKIPSDYLVVEDKEQPSTWHLQVRNGGAVDHRLMGAAWAALHEGYRGNKYEGPNKAQALAKLKRMYKMEKMPLPGSAKSIIDAPELRGSNAQACSNCNYAKWIEGTSDLVCSKYEFETEPDFVCDTFEQKVWDTMPMPVFIVDEPEMEESKRLGDDALLVYGDAVKATALPDGGVKLGGYLIRFSTSSAPDLTGDFFTAETDFGPAEKSDAWFNHRVPVVWRGQSAAYTERIGEAKLTRDEVGIFGEIVINARNDYEKMIAGLGLAQKLSWSSGTAPHLVDRAPVGKAFQIKRWPLGLDASLTPTPAEFRNQVIPIKSLTIQPLSIDATPEAAQENRNAEQDHGAAAKSQSTRQEDNGETIMDEKEFNELKALMATQGEQMKAQADKISALEATIKAAPAISTLNAAGVQVVLDEADRPFKSIADNCGAVKAYEISKGQKVHPRLTNPALKATGANESIPDQGGFLLDPTLTTEFLKPTHEVGQFSAMVRRLPVGGNSNYGWINGVDETDRATGSRWGGIRGYRLAEGDTKTSSKPKFRRINWELKKYAVLVYSTDELLQDASQFSAVVRQGVSEEIAFMLNDDIVNGSGAGGPHGFLASPSVISITKETNQAAATVVYENLTKMWQRLLPASKRSSGTAWFINSEVSPQLDSLSLSAGTAALPPRFVDYGADGVMRIKGKPVYETEFNAALGTAGDIVLADMAQYLMWEKSGIQEATSIHVQFLTDETVFRFVYRVDGQPVLASAVTPYKGTNTQSNFVTIETRS